MRGFEVLKMRGKTPMYVTADGLIFDQDFI
jgi:hypothetical protein